MLYFDSYGCNYYFLFSLGASRNTILYVCAVWEIEPTHLACVKRVLYHWATSQCLFCLKSWICEHGHVWGGWWKDNFWHQFLSSSPFETVSLVLHCRILQASSPSPFQGFSCLHLPSPCGSVGVTDAWSAGFWTSELRPSHWGSKHFTPAISPALSLYIHF